MTFTYNLATDIGKVRLLVGDVVEDDGPFPSKRNFTDEEIQSLLTEYVQVTRATAACLRILSNAFATEADVVVGPIKETYSTSAARLSKQADQLEGSAAFSVALTRKDGFSDS